MPSANRPTASSGSGFGSPLPGLWCPRGIGCWYRCRGGTRCSDELPNTAEPWIYCRWSPPRSARAPIRPGGGGWRSKVPASGKFQMTCWPSPWVPPSEIVVERHVRAADADDRGVGAVQVELISPILSRSAALMLNTATPLAFGTALLRRDCWRSRGLNCRRARPACAISRSGLLVSRPPAASRLTEKAGSLADRPERTVSSG